MARPDFSQFQNLLNSSKSVAVLLPHHPEYDTVSSALSLKLALETVGKQVQVACSDPMTVEFNRLVGVDSIISSFGSRNLVISFPGQTEHVDRITYNLEQGELQLVISPKPSSPDLDYRRLKFISSGSQYDLTILVGVHRLDDLGNLFAAAKDLLSSGKVVSLTREIPAQNYTNFQIYDSQASCISEIVTLMLDSLNISPNTDISSNLLAGLKTATDNFRSNLVTVSAYEAAVLLTRHGARPHDIFSPENLPPGAIPHVPSNQIGFGFDSQKTEEPITDTAAPAAAPSPDWYEPKIYQGTMLP